MKNVKLEIQFERELKEEKVIKSLKEEKYDLEIKDNDINEDIILNRKYNKSKKDEKRLEEKRRENLLKREGRNFKINKINNGFPEDKNILRKDLNYLINIKKYHQKNKKRNSITNTYIIIILFFTLIISNDNIYQNIFSNITLKIQGNGYNYVFSSNFEKSNYPNIIYINGIPNNTISN